MLANEINEEYGLTGQYLVDYCTIYGEDYNDKLLKFKDSNLVKSELLYLYKNASVSRYILQLIPAEEFENILLTMEEDFSKDWHTAGGGIMNLDDIATVQLQQKWELIYLILATYVGLAEDYTTYIVPIEDIMHKLILQMQLNNLHDIPTDPTIH